MFTSSRLATRMTEFWLKRAIEVQNLPVISPTDDKLRSTRSPVAIPFELPKELDFKALMVWFTSRQGLHHAAMRHPNLIPSCCKFPSLPGDIGQLAKEISRKTMTYKEQYILDKKNSDFEQRNLES
uniref:Uncharacterized protein n=1 Tax=Panagrolaimus sp. JU765 TaxID=591449 RepID=A0AC34QF04_9BILA